MRNNLKKDPKGSPSQSPRLRGTSYPGAADLNSLQPQRCCGSSFLFAFLLLFTLFPAAPVHAESLLLRNGVVHTVSGETINRGSVLIRDAKIVEVSDDAKSGSLRVPADATVIDLEGQHLYPGMIALNSGLGLTEIESVRGTIDSTEVSEFHPDVESWVAVNPDSELIPVTRANGITHAEPTPQGGVVAGLSGLVAFDGWTVEQMTIKHPTALHVYWPAMRLDTIPRERLRDPTRFKSLEDQIKDRQTKLKALDDFFADARAYVKAREAGTGNVNPPWEAMVPVVHGDIPIVIHADELRQINAAVKWAQTNGFSIILEGGRDAWRAAKLLAERHIPVAYEATWDAASDAENYDVHFKAPEVLRKAGVKVAFCNAADAMSTAISKNLPYAAAQAVAFGYPESEALKGLTLYPAQLLGVADRLGSIEAGREATLFVADGDILDIRASVKRMLIAGKEVSLASRHTRLYEKYKNRPKPK